MPEFLAIVDKVLNDIIGIVMSGGINMLGREPIRRSDDNGTGLLSYHMSPEGGALSDASNKATTVDAQVQWAKLGWIGWLSRRFKDEAAEFVAMSVWDPVDLVCARKEPWSVVNCNIDEREETKVDHAPAVVEGDA